MTGLRNFLTTYCAILAATLAAGLWLWMCWCIFPLHTWNDVRLEPSFLLAHGLPVYPTQTQGAVTTWIYGPLPVIFLWPATLARNVVDALLAGGMINLFFTAGIIGIVCVAWPASLSWHERLLAFAACVALWPAASFQYIQADNYAVACGLLANLLLIRCGDKAPGASRGWLAALGIAGAVMCKQTSVGLILAQCLWLGWKFSPRVAFVHSVRAGAVLAGLLALTLAWFGPEGVWFNLIEIPSHLPRTNEVLRRITDPWPLLVTHIVLPAILLIWAGRRVWRAEASLLLPAISWLCVLPAGIAGFMTLGGTLNSLQGLHYLLPPLILASLVEISRTRWDSRKALAVLSLLVLACLGTRIALSPLRPFRPITMQLTQATVFADQLRGRIWFPWNPLITFYSDGHFYHAEDGMYVRFVTGHPITYDQARAQLPPDWTVTALLGQDVDWGIALSLQPVDAISSKAGPWILYFWPPSSTSHHEKVDLSPASQTIPPKL
ncbi:MAG TPA: hypothetical protein VL357_03845 [Rariglobus sp.]|jgi:hypothetical protein|nr:hypothetical protein [Rariglobus sp.]